MSESREKLLKDIQEQGELVRKLKAAKESAEKVGVPKSHLTITIRLRKCRVCLAKKKVICREQKTLRLEKDTLQTKLPHAK